MHIRFLLPAVLVLAGAAPVWAGSPPRMVTATYQVADLVVPLDNPGHRSILEPPAPEKAFAPKASAPSCSTTTAAARTMEDRLIRLVTRTVAPHSWDMNGGPARIDYYPLGMTLVVTQTPDAQEQVANLLAALRRQQDVEVAVEVRLVRVPETFFERIGVDFNVKQEGPEPQPVPIMVQNPGKVIESLREERLLDNRQVARFFEVAQADPRTSVLQAPKLTVNSGQSAAINATDQHYFVTGIDMVRIGDQVAYTPRNEAFPLGFRMCVQPIVSADRRTVYVSLKLNQTELASGAVPLMPVTEPVKREGDDKGNHGKPVPFTQFIQQPVFNTIAVDQTLTIPDGMTVVLDGGTRTVETRTEMAAPALSKAPYVNRTFRNVGCTRESQQVLVLVTPRIVVSEEQEKVAPPRTAGPVFAQPQAAPLPVAEEQESMPHPRKMSAERRLALLLKKYHEACDVGDLTLAKKMALRALALDPTCFSKERPGEDR